MNTPIFDFVSEYIKKDYSRLHMPGHKGQAFLGCEKYDITEVNGADSLYFADGIIEESEKNASHLFGSNTFYSAEGSSLCIKAMLYLALMYSKNKRKSDKRPVAIAGRNAHKAFIDSAILLDFDIKWIYSDSQSYLSCDVTSEKPENIIEKTVKQENVFAFYITSPDYLGNMFSPSQMADIKAVCEKYDIPFIVDNAHGAYLKFLEASMHPIDFGADLVCDSAHKTLPVLTGGAYLHISEKFGACFNKSVKGALSLFGSTSPSYLILQSLDLANKYLAEDYRKKLSKTVKAVEEAKKRLINKGFCLCGNEPLKITISPKSYGYTGSEVSEILEEKNIVCEFSDPDFIVFMLSAENKEEEIKRLCDELCLIKKRTKIKDKPPFAVANEQVMSIREAFFSEKEEIGIEKSVGKILAGANISCPPAVSIAVCGERITEKTVEAFRYYKKEKCSVIKE